MVSNTEVVVEAKKEYTKQLCMILQPIVYEHIFSLYINVLETCENPKDVLMHFQKELQKIPKWNSDEITQRTNQVLDVCGFLSDLITMVFYANVRILSSVKIKTSGKNKKLKMVVPSNETFMHSVYKRVAKSIYNNPFLFSIQKNSGNVTNNINDVFVIIQHEIEDTIRDMLPMKTILESLSMHESDDEEEPEEELSHGNELPENDNESDVDKEEPVNAEELPDVSDALSDANNEEPEQKPDQEEVRKIDVNPKQSFFD